MYKINEEIAFPAEGEWISEKGLRSVEKMSREDIAGKDVLSRGE